jgi:small subunit ribosomal protein S14
MGILWRFWRLVLGWMANPKQVLCRQPPLGYDVGLVAVRLGPIRWEETVGLTSITVSNAHFFMAKKSMIEREKKRAHLVEKYAAKREALLEEFKSATSQSQRLAIHRKIQQLPRNSARVRMHNRCWVTGRPRGYYRPFGLSRNVLREWAHQGLLPGVVKSSW